jgi:O-antigen biosynthesis protein
MNSSAKRLVVVLGMHRSGTSAITRALNVLGVDIGTDLNPPVAGVNAKGFFEDIEIYSLNVEMLQSLGSDWYSLSQLAPHDIDRLRESGYFLRAVALLRKKTAGRLIFGFKDPRVAKLLPFWRQVFLHCRFDTDYLLMVRNPLSVVQSLAKRDDLVPERSYMLWLVHVLTSLVHTEKYRRVIIDYDLFLQDPRRGLERIANRFDLKFDSHEFDLYRSEFLDEELAHTVYEKNDLALDQVCPPIVQELYADLLDIAREDKELDSLPFSARTARWATEINRCNFLMRWIDDLSQTVGTYNNKLADIIKSALKQDGDSFRGSFDAKWYLHKYPDIVNAGVDPYQHYIKLGTKEGRLPSADVITFIGDGLSSRLGELNAQINRERLQAQTRLLELTELENNSSRQFREIQRSYEQQRDEQGRQRAEHERLLVAQLTEARQQGERYLVELAERERTYAQQFQVTQQAYKQQWDDQICRYTEREQAYLVQLAERERTHSQQRDQQIRQHAERERAYLVQLAERERTYSQQWDQQIRQHAEREQAYLVQLAERERTYSQQRDQQIRQHAEREQAYLVQLAERERTYSQQRDQQIRQHAEREEIISAELDAKGRECLNLTRQLSEQALEVRRLQFETDAMHATYSWRWTAPIRKLANLLSDLAGKGASHSSIAREGPTPAQIDTALEDQTQVPWVPRNSNRISLEGVLAHSDDSRMAGSLDELLAYRDERFIQCVYHTLLRRVPDAEGLRYYQARLHAGVPKMHIVGEIASSQEAVTKRVELLGLPELVKLQRLLRIPIIGRLLVGSFFRRPVSSDYDLNNDASKFNALLEHDDLRFIQSAYLMLLNRHPDPDGLKFYRNRLRDGVSKIQILGEIMESAEAASRAVGVLGWRAIVKLYSLSRLPLIGSLFTTPIIASDSRRVDRAGGGVKGSDVKATVDEIVERMQVEGSSRNARGSELIEIDIDGTKRNRKRITDGMPLISIVMPVYKTSLALLRCAIASVIDQSYSKWELCICDDGSGDQKLRKVLLDYAQLDNRIKLTFLDENIGISGASNKAIDIATGEFIAFLDHDDTLTIDALDEVSSLISENGNVDVVYSDQDKIDESGSVFESFYKPDWSPDYFRRVMYVGHLLVVRARLVREVGGFSPSFNRVQDYEFLLRISEGTSRIAHIPKILYHWRAIEGSIAATPNAKGEIESLQCEAVREHLERVGLKREVLSHPLYAHRAVIRPLKNSYSSKVSIIIPSKNHPEHIGRCLQSIFNRTTYQNFEVVVVDNGTTDSEALRILRNHPVTVLPYDEPFNYSRANNLGVECATGDVLILLNNDTEVITPDWIEVLLANLDQDDVGAVGPMLVYPNMTVQHAGIVLGPRGTADHVMRGFPWQVDGYAGSLSCVREVSGVTGACLMTRRDTYTEIRGLVEYFGTHYQDVDFCLRVRAKGKRILHVPDVQLIHYEGASRGSEYDLLDRLLLQDTWVRELNDGDPYFNPAFSFNKLDYSLAVES